MKKKGRTVLIEPTECWIEIGMKHQTKKTGVRSGKSEVVTSDAEQGMRVSLCAESVGVRGLGRTSVAQHHYMLRAEDFT
jgi:hypothetical protein